MSRFFSADRARLVAYVPGEQPLDKKYIKLNTNESPYPPAPGVIARLTVEEGRALKLYPDPAALDFRARLGEFYGVDADCVVPGNGSDEILSMFFLAFCDRQNGVAFPDISYGFYEVFADLYGLPAYRMPLREDMTVNPANYYGMNRPIIIANPNAPTGIALSRDEIVGIIEHNPDSVVAVDEAYVDFGGESCVALTRKYDNLVVIQTYSKSRSLAGARLGYAIACRELADDLNKIRYSLNPYNINRLTLAMGIAALDEDEYYKQNCARICGTRDWTAAELLKRGFTVTDSRTNFLFVKSDKLSGGAYYQKLHDLGILVRHFSRCELSNWNRITIGAREEMETLISATDAILGGYV